jgi:NAD(P)-dependent dehydrogenase (short-subunit alcohol dehydrogenase family)
MTSNDAPGTALIIGQGGIGAALAKQLRARQPVIQASRALGLNVTDEASISELCRTLPDDLSLIIITTGMLHDGQQKPEKSWRDIDAAQLARSFAINTIAPALLAKHLLPRLPRNQRAIFAVLSARVGSISDNRSGGWHGYRASKAALNMLIRNFAIEMSRTRPEAVCVGLHPGTVDTEMSRPFQANVSPSKLFSPDQSAAHLISVIDGLTTLQSGLILAWDGSVIPA